MLFRSGMRIKASLTDDDADLQLGSPDTDDDAQAGIVEPRIAAEGSAMAPAAVGDTSAARHNEELTESRGKKR